jgi:protein phosphatase 1 regulatory subunit 7
MPQLTLLELGANRIRVRRLHTMPAALMCWWTQEVSGLDSLSMLQELYLGKNKITTISGLSELLQLRVLSVQVACLLTAVRKARANQLLEQPIGQTGRLVDA